MFNILHDEILATDHVFNNNALIYFIINTSLFIMSFTYLAKCSYIFFYISYLQYHCAIKFKVS